MLGRELRQAGQAARISALGTLASRYPPQATLRLEATEVRPGEALLAVGPLPPRAEPIA